MILTDRITVNGLTRYLLSEDNLLMMPNRVEIYQDMTQPLSHYFINSSHNTYLVGELLMSYYLCFSWYLLGVLFKILDKHPPSPFYIGVPPSGMHPPLRNSYPIPDQNTVVSLNINLRSRQTMKALQTS